MERVRRSRLVEEGVTEMPDQERTLAVVLAELRLIAWPSTADCERFEALKCEAITLNAAQQKRITELSGALRKVENRARQDGGDYSACPMAPEGGSE